MNATKTGLLGEYIAAAAVIDMGWSVSLAQQDGCDLVAWDDEQNYIRIQAKTANLSVSKDGRPQVHHFNCAKGSKSKYLPTIKDFDCLALVSPIRRLVLWMPIQSVSFKSRRVSPDRFTKDAEQNSWDKAVAVILEARE